jgi:hypothetical protein
VVDDPWAQFPLVGGAPAVAPAAPAGATAPPQDDPWAAFPLAGAPVDQGPTFAERLGFRPATRQEAIVGRGAAEGVLSPVDLAAHIVQSSGSIPYSPLDLIAGETGQQPTEEQEAATTPTGKANPLPIIHPSQQLLDFIGLKAPDNMTPGEQTEASIIPWVTPTPGMVGRVMEAPGLLTKGVTALSSAAGGVADWAASGAMQEYAEAHGWGPVATELSSILATQGRHLPGHIISGIDAVRGGGKPVLGREGAGETYDSNVDLGVQPPIEDVAGDKLRSTVSALNASVVPGTGSSVAKDLQTKGIVKAYDQGKDLIDPDAPSVATGSPATLNDYSEMLSTRARNQIDANRVAAKAESNRLEQPIVSAPIDAAPVQAALNNIITNPNKLFGTDSRKAAQGLLDRFNEDVDPTNNTISFAQMKEQRENFKSEASKLLSPAQTGVANTSATVGKNISPVEQAMTNGMVDVAGPDWAANDAKWSQNSAELRSLRPVTGKLGRKSGDWQGTPDSSKVAKSLTKSVKGNMPVLDNLEKGMPGESRSATGQVLASLGTPESGTGSGTFRSDKLATQYPAAVGKGMRARIANQGPVGPRGPEPPGRGAEALAQMDKAVAAAKGTVRPEKPGGLEGMLGAFSRVLPYAHDIGGLGAAPALAAAVGGPVGLAGALAGRALLPRLLNDPSLVRLVAGRRFTANNIAGVLGQYAQRAGLAATGPKPPPVSGMGASALEALKNLPSWRAMPGVNQMFGGAR